MSNLSEKQKEMYNDTIFLKEDYESLLEAPNIGYDEKNNICVEVKPDPGRNLEDSEYFKVLDHKNFTKAEKIARIMFKEAKYVSHTDGSGKKPWKLNTQEKKALIALLQKVNKRTGNTIWKDLILTFNEYVKNDIKRENSNYKGIDPNLNITDYKNL